MITAHAEMLQTANISSKVIDAVVPKPFLLEDLRKAIELDPEQVEPLLNLGVLYQRTGHKEQALHYLTLFLEKAPPENYSHLLPQVREAIQELRRGS